MEHAALRSYVAGFILSLVLTGAAYLITVSDLMTSGWLTASIISLALAQALVQLIFFLHLGRETRPRWKLAVLVSMLVVLGILVFGSLWIMQHLNYNMMPDNVESHVKHDEGFN